MELEPGIKNEKHKIKVATLFALTKLHSKQRVFLMFELIKKWLAYLYLHYELATCVYMFEPWERKLINGFVIVILCLITFSSYVYLPKYTETLLQFLSPAPMVGEVPVQSAQRIPIS